MEALGIASAARPLEALAQGTPGTLAIITGVEGPSYRPVGAMMAVLEGRRRVGNLSSGCVEGDIALHAEEARARGRPRQIRYGLGSPYKDITLPCGGGLDVLLLPEPDREAIAEALARHRARRGVTLVIDPETGAVALADDGPTGWQGGRFLLRLEPEIAFWVIGKGPEAATFAMLARSADFPVILMSPDEETLAQVQGQAPGCLTRHLVAKRLPEDLAADAHTAAVLFFHDHEWEPPLLAALAESPAFYIGAQGSRRSRERRDAELLALGVAPERVAQMRGPIGLVPSARDARTLAVSVLAEVLAERP